MFGFRKVQECKFEYTLLMIDGRTVVIVAESLPWTHPALHNKISEIISVRNAK